MHYGFWMDWGKNIQNIRSSCFKFFQADYWIKSKSLCTHATYLNYDQLCAFSNRNNKFHTIFHASSYKGAHVGLNYMLFCTSSLYVWFIDISKYRRQGKEGCLDRQKMFQKHQVHPFQNRYLCNTSIFHEGALWLTF